MESDTKKREEHLQKIEEETARREKAEIACANILEDMEAIAHHIAAKIDTDNGDEDIEGLAAAAAKVATAAAHLRMSVGYTFGMGCYAGMTGETEES
ncbi:MAG: hypothetical protein J6M56_00300 [Clostridia bacterium]|nr:hypothetical protein [Clostridia bacterium]